VTKKIYFAPNWGLSSEQMVEDYRHQTPESSGVWEDIEYTLDSNSADYLIVQDLCDMSLWSKFEPEQRLYFSREALTPNDINRYHESDCRHFSFWNDTGHLWVKWWYPNKNSGGINMTYDELLNMEPPSKTKNISCILSDKEMNYGHAKRKRFTREFLNRNRDSFDLYGSVSFSNRTLIDDDKRNGILDYRYTLAFDNQNTIKNFFGTQFTDAILTWTVPFFWGGGNSEYFPEKSFDRFDVDDYNEIDRLLNIVNDPSDYDDRLDAVSEARQLILNQYNMWPTIKKAIENL
jgi:hypothetical protein